MNKFSTPNYKMGALILEIEGWKRDKLQAEETKNVNLFKQNIDLSQVYKFYSYSSAQIYNFKPFLKRDFINWLSWTSSYLWENNREKVAKNSERVLQLNLVKIEAGVSSKMASWIILQKRTIDNLATRPVDEIVVIIIYLVVHLIHCEFPHWWRRIVDYRGYTTCKPLWNFLSLLLYAFITLLIYYLFDLYSNKLNQVINF